MGVYHGMILALVLGMKDTRYTVVHRSVILDAAGRVYCDLGSTVVRGPYKSRKAAERAMAKYRSLGLMRGGDTVSVRLEPTTAHKPNGTR